MPKPPKPLSDKDSRDAEGGGGYEERQRLEIQNQDSTIDRDKKQGGPEPLKTPPPPD